MATGAASLCLNCTSAPQLSGHPFCGRSCAAQYLQKPGRSSLSVGITLCANCRVRPQSPGHPYCSRSCSQVALPIVSTTVIGGGSVIEPADSSTEFSISVGRNQCKQCNVRPKLAPFDFCSKSCGATWGTLILTGSAGTTPYDSQRQFFPSQPLHGICQLSGCSKLALKGSHYCCLSHRDQAKLSIPKRQAGDTTGNVCLYCGQNPPLGRSFFCSLVCTKQADSEAPGLLHINANHPVFDDIVQQFNSTWKVNPTPPTVRQVFKILATPQSLQEYDAYRTKVEAKGNFVAQGRSAGNQNRRWHGTSRGCTLGEAANNTTLCDGTYCYLCSIIKTSYRPGRGGTFGAGIYTSSRSSKSDAYSRNSVSSPYKAIILNNVIVGRGEKLKSGASGRTAPSPGYDSVLGELGNDELIVYTKEAIRPSFLVVYGGLR